MEITIVAVFVAGFITGFLPCTFPLIAGYIALILGTKDIRVRTSLRISLFFFIGFSVVYVFFGSVSGFFGILSKSTLFFYELRLFLQWFLGFVVVLFGLITLKVVILPSKLKIHKSLKIPNFIMPSSNFGALILGSIFALSYSPCIGPILGGVLLLSSTFESIFYGMFLLFVFSLGLMVPVLSISILYSIARERLSFFENKVDIFRIIGGILLIFIGIMIISGNFGFLYGVSTGIIENSFLGEKL